MFGYLSERGGEGVPNAIARTYMQIKSTASILAFACHLGYG